MGANQSGETRSVSMDNPNPVGVGVIDISEEVVQRLKLGLSRVKQQEKQGDSKKPETPKAIPVFGTKKTSSEPPKSDTPQPASIPKSLYTNPNPTPSTSQTKTPSSGISRFVGEPIITAMEMRRQQEVELRENDKIWEKRMTQLENNLKKTNEILKKEYSVAYEDAQKRFIDSSGLRHLPPCQDLKSQVIACYRTYPHETLKCAHDVDKFIDCVASHRIKRLDYQKTPAKGA